MPKDINSFAEWRRLTEQTPERLADTFLERRKQLPPESLRALFASVPERDELLRNIEAACADTEAPLSGVPYVLQDLFDVDGLPTRLGAPFQDLFQAPLEDAALLYRKLKSLGGILLAKTVPSEFGVDLRGRNQSFGDCPHADGPRYICGGGAGACAHTVSAGWVPLAFGLDSSAGIRIPAAFHGLFGFRMNTNIYAREGVFPIVPSLESVGWLTAQAEDLQSMIDIFQPPPRATPKTPLRGYFFDDPSVPLNAELKNGMMRLIHYLDTNDCPDTNKTLFEAFKGAGDAFTTIESRELYSIHQYWIEEYRSQYPEPLLRRIEAGQNCTPKKADHSATIQQNIRKAMVDFFQKYDYLIIPISPIPTPEKAEWSEQLDKDLLQLNAPASLSFLPALILPFPCGEGRHSAIQLILNPRKVHNSTEILKQVSEFYG